MVCDDGKQEKGQTKGAVGLYTYNQTEVFLKPLNVTDAQLVMHMQHLLLPMPTKRRDVKNQAMGLAEIVPSYISARASLLLLIGQMHLLHSQLSGSRRKVALSGIFLWPLSSIRGISRKLLPGLSFYGV